MKDHRLMLHRDSATDTRQHLKAALRALESIREVCARHLPKGVLGFDVYGCKRLRGHEGEHESTSQGTGQTISWRDDSAQWGQE